MNCTDWVSFFNRYAMFQFFVSRLIYASGLAFPDRVKEGRKYRVLSLDHCIVSLNVSAIVYMETVISNFKSSKQNFILSIYFQTVTYPLESSSANISTSTLDRRGSQNVGKSFNNSVFWITMVFSRQLMEFNEKEKIIWQAPTAGHGSD